MYIKDTLESETIKLIQKMFMEYLHSSTEIFEADGTNTSAMFEGQYCSFLNQHSYENALDNSDYLQPCKWTCHRDCWQTSRKSMESKQPVEKLCTGGIYIYAVPIFFKDKVIGSINAGVTNPPLDNDILSTVAQRFNVDLNELRQCAYAYRRLSDEQTKIAKMQIRMAALLISTLYESKMKQLAAEEENRLQKEQLELVLDNMEDGLVVFDKEGRYILQNRKVKEFVVKSTHLKNTVDKVGESLSLGEAYYDADGAPLALHELPNYRVLQGEAVRNQVVMFNNGSETYFYQYNGKPVYGANGEFKLGIINCHDISERIKKGNELKKQQEELKTIINNIDEAIFILDSNRNYYLTNKAAREYYPNMSLYKLGDVFSNYKYYDFKGNEISLDNITISKVLKGKTIAKDLLTLKNNHTTKHISANGTPIYDDNGNLKYAVLSIHDITEEINKENIIKEQQKQLLKREVEKREALEAAMQLKDEFIYLITHEFRTPMAVVNSALQAIELICKGEVTEKVGKYLNTIKQNTNRQLRLVNNLLDITRISSGNIKLNRSVFDIIYITESIVNSVQVYAKQKGVNIFFHSSVAKKSILLDEEKYERILLNLIANALKFTPKGKSIQVSVATKKRSKKNWICIKVSDEGIGIPKSKQHLIFERFGQADTSLSRQAEGTGLGLHLVKLLMNAFGGKISLESEEGKGSTFTLLLPVHSQEYMDEVAAALDSGNLMLQNDSRLVQAMAIEFSDIYF